MAGPRPGRAGGPGGSPGIRGLRRPRVLGRCRARNAPPHRPRGLASKLRRAFPAVMHCSPFGQRESWRTAQEGHDELPVGDGCGLRPDRSSMAPPRPHLGRSPAVEAPCRQRSGERPGRPRRKLRSSRLTTSDYPRSVPDPGARRPGRGATRRPRRRPTRSRPEAAGTFRRPRRPETSPCPPPRPCPTPCRASRRPTRRRAGRP